MILSGLGPVLPSTKDYNLLSVSIPTYSVEKCPESQQPFASFHIQIRYGEEVSWEVCRRQRQFQEIDLSLHECYPDVPRLPTPINWFGLKHSTNNLDRRKAQYETYLTSLLFHEKLYSVEKYLTFLEVREHTPFLVINLPVFQGGVVSLGRIYLACTLLLLKDAAIVVTGEMLGMNKLDSYLANYIEGLAGGKTGIEVTQATDKCVGLVEYLRRVDAEEYVRLLKAAEEAALKKKYNGNFTTNDPRLMRGPRSCLADPEDETPEVRLSDVATPPSQGLIVPGQEDRCYFNFVKEFDKGFKYQVECMVYSEKINCVVVGLDSGSVMAFAVSQTGFVGEKSQSRAHAGGVVKLAIDEERYNVISVGRDNILLVYGLKEEFLKGKAALPGGKPPSNLIYDQARSLAFVSNEGQSVYVFDLKGPHYDIVRKISTKVSPPLAGLFGDFYASNILAVSSLAENKIRFFHCSNYPSKDSSCRAVLDLSTPAEPRIIIYSPQRKEVYSGHSNGVVRVYTGIDLTKLPLGRKFSPGPQCNA